MAKDDSKEKRGLRGRSRGGKVCGLAAKGKVKKMAKLARGAAFICANCGYVSSDAGDLCRPQKL